jgi:hypothetical protein
MTTSARELLKLAIPPAEHVDPCTKQVVLNSYWAIMAGIILGYLEERWSYRQHCQLMSAWVGLCFEYFDGCGCAACPCSESTTVLKTEKLRKD